jgi:surface carbohydrate biosynthesis protein (TIGR04326 family)
LPEDREKVLLVWDSAASAPAEMNLVYTWNGYSENAHVHSLLRYVDAHGEGLRRKYLAFIHDLGESRIDGVRIIDQLAGADGSSYWWMTRLVEQNPWKSPSITDVIRVMALEEILETHKPAVLRLVSDNRDLGETLRNLSEKFGIVFNCSKPRPEVARMWQRRGSRQAIPVSLRALARLVSHVWTRWRLRRTRHADWFAGDDSLFICSYFFHVVPEEAERGNFHSHYWEALHGWLRANGLNANWLQLYYRHEAVPNPDVATNWVRRFNAKREDNGSHRFVDSYLSWRVIARVLKQWLGLWFDSFRLRRIRLAFQPHASNLSLWPLMRRDWQTSMRGPAAIENLLWKELFDRALRDAPHQRSGMFLLENQSWERALIQAWRKHGHGRLIGVAHSTVRFWDLRYFTDPRTLRSSDPHPMPRADRIALNGKAACDSLIGAGYPECEIVECEALRFGHLNHVQPTNPATHKASRDLIRVLILGDYFRGSTIKMLQLVQAAAPNVTRSAKYSVKPHPNSTIQPGEFPRLPFDIATGPFGAMLCDYDVVISSNMTSAAIDAYFAGLPVVVMLEDSELNFSPLRGRVGVRFVSTPAELAEALTVMGGAENKPDGRDYFFLDPALPRWSGLLLSC